MTKKALLPLTLLLIVLLASCSTTKEAKKPTALPEAKPIATPITIPVNPPKEETPLAAEVVEETVEKPATEVTLETEATIKGESSPDTEEELQPEPEAEKRVITPFKEVELNDVTSAFNYAYGIETMESLMESGISFKASYFVRGVFDAVYDRTKPQLVPMAEIKKNIEQYVYTYLQKGQDFGPGERPEGMEDLMSLSTGLGLEESFSYAYAFDFVSDCLYSEVDILPDEFTRGALDALYGTKAMDKTETQRAVDAYITYLNEIYYAEQAQKANENLAKAEAYLKANGEREEVVTMENGIQFELLGEDEILGQTPEPYDTVLIDYNKYVLDYETEELKMVDADWFAEIDLSSAEDGLRESILLMKVGQAARTFVPPVLAYGAEGTEEIAPYSILVYDIALNGIL